VVTNPVQGETPSRPDAESKVTTPRKSLINNGELESPQDSRRIIPGALCEFMTWANLLLVAAAQAAALRRKIMKKLMMLVASFAFVLALSPLAQAQMDEQRAWKANVPYSFQVENKQLPAGQYLVKWIGGRLHIQSVDGENSATFLALPVEGKVTQSKSRLVFNNYGDTHFLTAVYFAGTEQSRELLKSKAEMQIARSKTPSKETVLAGQ
jgi:hypothetical protein